MSDSARDWVLYPKAKGSFGETVKQSGGFKGRWLGVGSRGWRESRRWDTVRHCWTEQTRGEGSRRPACWRAESLCVLKMSLAQSVLRVRPVGYGR